MRPDVRAARPSDLRIQYSQSCSEKLLGPHQQVLDTLAAHPSPIVPLLVFPTTGMMIYPFLDDRFHRLPALAAARALIAHTGCVYVLSCMPSPYAVELTPSVSV